MLVSTTDPSHPPSLAQTDHELLPDKGILSSTGLDFHDCFGVQ